MKCDSLPNQKIDEALLFSVGFASLAIGLHVVIWFRRPGLPDVVFPHMVPEAKLKPGLLL